MKRRIVALGLVFMLLMTNLVSLAETSISTDTPKQTVEVPIEPEKKDENILSEKGFKLRVCHQLLHEEIEVVVEEVVEVESEEIELSHLAKAEVFKKDELGYIYDKVVLKGRRIKGEVSEVERVQQKDLEQEGEFYLITLVYALEEHPLEVKEEEDLKHLFVYEEDGFYSVYTSPYLRSPRGLESGEKRHVTVIPIDPSGSWAFFHVWDKTKDPMSAVTSTFAYFKLDDGSIGFCMHPGLDSPQGNLPVDIFAHSDFRRFAEQVSTLAIGSGGLAGYSFEENFVFAQMYIWQNITFSDGSGQRYALDFRYQHSPFTQHAETTARYQAWKGEIDAMRSGIGLISFDGETLEMEVGKEYRIEDTNGQLHKFNIKGAPEGIAVKKENNTLVLRAQMPIEAKLEFWQARGDYPLPEVSFILRGPDNTYQDLGVFRDPFVCSLHIHADEVQGHIKIIKRGESGQSIPGAVFELAETESFHEILETLTTDAQGTVMSRGYNPREMTKLYIREKSVPHPYEKSDEIKEVTLEAAKTVSFTFVNKLKPGRIALIKKGSDGKRIAGAVFELSYDKKFSEILEVLITGKEGEALSSPIPMFNDSIVYLREKSVPEPYIKDDVITELRLEAGKTLEHVLTNDIKRICLTKTDIVSSEAVPGAMIELTDPSGVKKEYVTDNNGQVRIEGLESGDYTFKEILSPMGYVLNPESFSFSISKEGEVSGITEFFNEPTRLKILKTDPSGQPLEGAGFRVYFSDGEQVRTRYDAQRGCYIADAKGEENILMSAKDGWIYLDYLPQGHYRIKEVVVPSGYKKTPAPEDEKTFSMEAHSLTDPGILHFVNAPIEVVLTKTDLATDEGVPGATIELTDEKGGKQNYVTDEKGEVKIKGLHPGRYVFREILAPQGYILNTQSFVFTLDPEGQIDGVTEFTNTPTRLHLLKKDKNTGEAIKGAAFAIFFLGGERDGESLHVAYDEKSGHYRAEASGESYLYTDEKGEAYVDYLPQGRYRIKEVKAAPGYVLDIDSSTKGIDFILDEKKGHQELTFFNEPTQVILVKRDMLTSKGLAGAQFELNFKGKKQSFVTDEEGKITLTGLEAGTYTFKEKHQPAGYVLEKESFTFFIDDKGVMSGIREMTNEPTRLILKKVNEKGEALAGVAFEILDSSGHIIKGDKEASGNYRYDSTGKILRFVTDKKGEILMDYLPEGLYTLREVQPLEGYSPLKEMKITLKDHGINHPLTLEIVNKKELPKTGEKADGLWVGMAFFFLSLASWTRRHRWIK